MADFPILFTIRHVVKGPTFEAVVTANGRTLITQDAEEWWCLGVEPGGIAELGEGPISASERFTATFRHALEDLAETAEDFESFQTDACAFFRTDEGDADRWEAALNRIHGSSDVPEALRNLPRKIWTGESDIEVLRLKDLDTSPTGALVQENRAIPEAA